MEGGPKCSLNRPLRPVGQPQINYTIMEITKIDDNQINVKKVETKETENIFTYEYLVSQREAIQAQKDRDNVQRDLELAEIDILLSECGKLNVVAKPLELESGNVDI